MASKKKISGNTMTLRDFHGGSIPSDLPLPSAPSLTVKPSDRSSGNYERASSWGNRSRPHTSPSSTKHHLDEKTPFFAHTPQIGRNFDEDERKPLDSVSAPRRTVRGDDTFQLQGASNFTSGGTSSSASWSAPNAVSKLVHSSSLEKVSSSTWNSSKTLHHHHYHQPQHVDAVNDGEKEHCDGVLARHAESVLAVIDDDDQRVDGDGGRNEFVGSKLSEMQQPVLSGPSERPKLKLLPRTKAMESSEPSVPDYVQVHGQANSVKPVSDGTGSGKEAGCPKLNLKLRLQPIEQLEEKTERGRNALFGGARPRELVLKERGIDAVAIKNFDVVEHSNRIEHTSARAEKLPDNSYQTRYEGGPHDRRTGKKLERKEQRVDIERVNARGKNWRSDNRRNAQETDKKQASERQPLPETWRKPAEQPKSGPGAVSTGHSKAASAVELAQAFSRSAVSDPKVNVRFSGERGLSTNNRTQVPFSRLVSPTTAAAAAPRPQINGY